MEYTTVFDVGQSGYRQWSFPAFGLIFVTLGIGSVVFRRQLRSRMAPLFPFVFLGFALFWTLAAFVGTVSDYWSLSSALREDRCIVVEGVVSDFHPMPYTGHQNEWFVVDGKRFEYSDYGAVAGFNNTASHGGPIRKGLQVRVHYVGNDIARLEVAR